MTRYFKHKDGRTICSTSSGNRSKEKPGTPCFSDEYIEIEKKEFYALKRRILGSYPDAKPFKKVVV